MLQEYIQDQINKIRNPVEEKQSGMVDCNEGERKVPQKQNYNLSAKKKDFKSGKDILRICSETLL